MLAIIPVSTIISAMLMSIVNKDYLPYQKAAEELGLSAETVRRYIHAKLINAEKVGTTWFVHRKEVDRYNRERLPVGRQAKNF